MIIHVCTVLYLITTIGCCIASEHQNAVDQEQIWAFFDACYRGNTETLAPLLQRWPKLAEAEDKPYMDTALRRATLLGHLSVVELLLHHKADPNKKDHFESTPLHIASIFGRAEVASTLLAHAADVRAVDRIKNTPAHDAACHGHSLVVEILLKHNALINAKNHYDKTPLHYAAIKQQVSTIEMLLLHKADFSIKNSFNNIPLRALFKRDSSHIDIRILQLFIAAGHTFHSDYRYARWNQGDILANAHLTVGKVRRLYRDMSDATKLPHEIKTIVVEYYDNCSAVLGTLLCQQPPQPPSSAVQQPNMLTQSNMVYIPGAKKIPSSRSRRKTCCINQ